MKSNLLKTSSYLLEHDELTLPKYHFDEFLNCTQQNTEDGFLFEVSNNSLERKS